MALAPVPQGQSYIQPLAAWSVTLEGEDLTTRMRPRLIELSLTEKRGEEADELSIVLHDADGALGIPPPGALLSVAIGWERGTGVTIGLVDKGQFRVDELAYEGPPDVLRITARSADLTAGLRRRRDRSWVARTIGQIIATIAGEHGLTPRVHASLAAITVPAAQQSSKSDIAFVRDLGRRYDAIATVKAGQLLFAPIGMGESVGGTPLPSASIARSDCARWGWSRKARDEHQGAEAQWSDRPGARRRRVRVGGGDNPRRLRRTYASEAEARAAATAASRRDARQSAEVNLTLSYGDARVFPERPVSLAGFKGEIDAAGWQIAEATHSLGPSGFSTTLRLDLGETG